MKTTPHPVEREELMAYLDGELPVERASALAAHLDECLECQALSKEFRAVSERLTAWQVEPSPARLSEKVSQAAQETAQQMKSESAKARFKSDERTRRPFLRWAVGLSAAGAALALLFAISIPNLLRSRIATQHGLTVDTPIPPAGPVQARQSLESKTLQAARGLTGPMIIRTAQLTLITKDFDSSRPAVERIVRQHQGYIAQLNVIGATGSARYLTATLRVPSDQLPAALAELKQLGKVLQESQSGEEVTEQYVDLNARLSNARVTEQRLAEILRNRTGKVSDVLEVEREIARVRGQIERIDAERQNLEKRVSYATVEVQLREEYKAEIEMAPPSIGSQLWNAAVGGYLSLAESALGLALTLLRYGPSLLFWAALLFWPARLVWKRLRA